MNSNDERKMDPDQLDNVTGGVGINLFGDKKILWSATEKDERIKNKEPDGLNGLSAQRRNNPGGIVGA